MSRWFLCFLLCLMPLRLWAGVWMPMAQSNLHHGLDSANHTQRVEVGSAHDCHEVMAASPHDADTQLQAMPETTEQKADCHDGTCQLCGLCHLSANLAIWPVMVSVFQAHPQPLGVTLAHVARTAPPLIKPPIF